MCIIRQKAVLIPFFREFDNIIDSSEQLIVAGDLNINMMHLDPTTIQFLDIINISGATVTNNAITRTASQTLIDYFIIKNFPSNVLTETFTSCPLISSDHNLLLLLINMCIPRMETKTIISTKYNYNYLKEIFVCDRNKMNKMSAELCCNFLCDSIREAMSASSTT